MNGYNQEDGTRHTPPHILPLFKILSTGTIPTSASEIKLDEIIKLLKRIEKKLK